MLVHDAVVAPIMLACFERALGKQRLQDIHLSSNAARAERHGRNAMLGGKPQDALSLIGPGAEIVRVGVLLEVWWRDPN